MDDPNTVTLLAVLPVASFLLGELETIVAPTENSTDSIIVGIIAWVLFQSGLEYIGYVFHHADNFWTRFGNSIQC